MTRKATTFRLDPEVQAALSVLSDVQGRPQNQLVNEAVREFVSKPARAVEVDLEALFTRLRADSLDDPVGAASMATAMRAEAAFENDPAGGVRVVRRSTAGPVSARMLDVRTVPVPAWVKAAMDAWTSVAGITSGAVFRAIDRRGRVWGNGMTAKVLWDVVRTAAGPTRRQPHWGTRILGALTT